MEKIYVVVGSTGEYSDYRVWSVAAYKDEAMARKHAEEAKTWYLESNDHKNPFDPDMIESYVGTDWTVQGIDWRDELPGITTD